MATSEDSPKTASPRVLALDALRGLALLGMALSDFVPKLLPAWMYHGQNAPPSNDTVVTIFGITWVDLVFPFFLFAMGAAIPLAIRARMDRGATSKDIAKWLLIRGALLAVFSLVDEHFRAGVFATTPDATANLATILGCALMFLMFARWPANPSTPEMNSSPAPGGGREGANSRRFQTTKILTWLGWMGAFLLLVSSHYADGNRGFANYRLDIILMVLANMALFGGAIWFLTQTKPLVRWAICASVFMIFLTKDLGGVGTTIWQYTPIQHLQKDHWPYLLNFDTWPYQRFVPIVYHFEYIKYLLIVIPGTICGDLYRERFTDNAETWEPWRSRAAGLIGVAMSAIATIGLFAREVVATTLVLFALSAISLRLLRKPGSALEQRIRKFAEYGTAFVVFGLLVEPLGGGIRKASPTASYFLLTTGLAFFALVGLSVLIDVAKRDRWIRTTTELGQNPILGYILTTNLVPAIFGLIAANEFAAKQTDNPWLQSIVAFIETLVVAYAAAWFTRRKVFLRT